MTLSFRGLPALLLAAWMAGLSLPAAADPPTIVPLYDYAEHYGGSGRSSRRFILNRCTALYIFASSTVKDRRDPAHDAYEARASLFLAAAKAATDHNEVLLMLLTRMSTAYKRSSDAEPGSGDPLAHPFFRSELAFCGSFSTEPGARARRPSPL